MNKRLLVLFLLSGIAGLTTPGWAQKPAGKAKSNSMCECGYICANAKSNARCKVDRCDGKKGTSQNRKKGKERPKLPTTPDAGESATAN